MKGLSLSLKRTAIFLCLCVGMLALNPCAFTAETLSIRADVWMPYNGEPAGDVGYMVEVLKKVYSEFNVVIDYQTMPWARAIKEVRDGNFDAVIGAYKMDVPDFVFPQEHFTIGGEAFFVLSSKTWEFKDHSSLKQQKMGCIKDYSYGEDIDKYIKENPTMVECVSGDDPLEQNIKKLIAGRIDVLIEDAAVFWWKVHSMSGIKEKVKSAGSLGKNTPMYIAFSPQDKKKAKSKEYADKFDQGFKKLVASGEIARLKDKYKIAK
ncbi:MAG: transporter substrate-binding domain-containing protein [Oligoflexia bacterium]|nr:transporter substrate-binding domain-containing protein [Oligoflexia bacterium]